MPSDLHLIIANKAYSSWSMRPWIAMKAFGLDFRETVICLGQPDTAAEIGKYSDAGKVPVLRHGPTSVWESIAILEYLADVFPGRGWWPGDRAARAAARAISAEMHAGFANLRIAMPMNVRKVFPPRDRAAAVDADIARISALWREARTAFGAGGPFLFGAFSNADAMYAPVVTRFRTYGVTLEPVAQAYCEAMLALPAMQAWYAGAAEESWVIEKYELAAEGAA